jgi:D-serine dehydratase
VLRPGCYVTHDNGRLCAHHLPHGEPLPGMARLQHALEVWGVVQSVPEPGLAIVGVGKRDASYDVEPPIPLWVHTPGEERPREAQRLQTLSMWDQHLSIDDPDGSPPHRRSRRLGISHPCGTFDRWTAQLTVR